MTIVHQSWCILIVVEPTPIGIEAGCEVVGIVTGMVLGGNQSSRKLWLFERIVDITGHTRTVGALLGGELLEQHVTNEAV